MVELGDRQKDQAEPHQSENLDSAVALGAFSRPIERKQPACREFPASRRHHIEGYWTVHTGEPD